MSLTYFAESKGTGRRSVFTYGRLVVTLLAGMALVSVCFGQVAFTTGRADNQRTGASLNETLLTPQNVNKNDFGFLFSYPIDYLALAQPLYVPNVNIPGQGMHNVVYVATMADSVYAFDADSNTGAPLWSVNFTNPANGITTASGQYLPCSGKGVGFLQEGIAGTPTIDTTTGTIYLVAKTLENGTVIHRLHALDITNGQEKFGGPVVITATSVSNQGRVANFDSLHEKNRPGLLLSNSVVYAGFGSNGCNDGDETGWVIGYNAGNLSQVGSFNSSADHGGTSVWQSGNGLAADQAGNILYETAEACPKCYNVPQGGQTYSNSVIKLAPDLSLADYFTPATVAFLNTHDEDLSSTGVLVLTNQDGPYPTEVVAGGKQGFIYVLNGNNLGMFTPEDSGALEEFPVVPGEGLEQTKSILFSSPAYWNHIVYYAPDGSPIQAYPVSAGLLGTPVLTAQKYVGAHSPSVSANGNGNGIMWALSGGNLDAFDALSMNLLYSSKQVLSRDELPPVAHFATQTVVNGKVYVATQTTLSAYGLFQNLSIVGGANQSAEVLMTLPAPIQIQVVDPYNNVGIPGITVSFSDGGKGGTFNPPSAVSDASGNVSTSYTLPQKAGVYTITASASKTGNLTVTETALSAAPAKVLASKGAQQTGQAGSILPVLLRAAVQDVYKNGVPGITVTFADKSQAGTLSPLSGVSDANGYVQVSYQLPNVAGKYQVSASALTLKAANFTEHAAGDAPANVIVASGNNQTAPVNTTLAQPLVVQLTDQGGIPITGVSVVFSAPAGTLSGTPATTDSNGMAAVSYTTGNSPGTVTVTASVNALNAQFTVNVTGSPQGH